jgi:putative hemolysin
MAILLLASVLMSDSEMSFFSFSPVQLNKLNDNQSIRNPAIMSLLEQSERPRTTILIGYNLVNVGIVILFTFLCSSLFYFSSSPLFEFILQLMLITLVILVLGVKTPGIYSAETVFCFTAFMALPMLMLVAHFRPLSSLLLASTPKFNKYLVSKEQNLLIDGFNNALDLDGNEIIEEKQILKGIVPFGSIDVMEIMTPGMNVVAADLNFKFKKLLSVIVNSGYSRFSIYNQYYNNVKGVFYVNDLLSSFNENDEFEWQKLIWPTYCVSELKKNNDLLWEFQ